MIALLKLAKEHLSPREISLVLGRSLDVVQEALGRIHPHYRHLHLRRFRFGRMFNYVPGLGVVEKMKNGRIREIARIEPLRKGRRRKDGGK